MDRWDDADGDDPGPGPDDDVGTAFEDWYDDVDLALIDAGPRAVGRSVGVVGWSRTTAFGAVLTGLALGLKEVFQPEEEQAIVIEVDESGEPFDLPVQLFLDPDSPEGSLCLVRRDRVDPPVV